MIDDFYDGTLIDDSNYSDLWSEFPQCMYVDDNLEVVRFEHKSMEYPDFHRSRRKLSECKTTEELFEECECDAYQHGQIEFHPETLFDIVKSKIIKFEGRKHQHIAMDLAALIQIRNAAVTSTDIIAETIDMNKNQLPRTLKPLEDNGFIKVFAPCGKKSNVRTILFNPSLFWKGDYTIRNMVSTKARMTGEWQLDV